MKTAMKIIGKTTRFLTVILVAYLMTGPAHMARAAAAPVMIAHRGYNTVAPENTLAAFREAGKAGFWGIETDLKETADGVLVCSHEDSLSVKTNGKGYIHKKKYSYIKKLRVIRGNGRKKYPKERIPRLEEYLDVCRQYGCVAILDLKYSSVAAVKKAYKLVRKKDMLDQTVFQSSVKLYLQTVRKMDKKACLWYLANSISSAVIRTARNLKCQCVTVGTVTKSAVNKAHKNGLRVCCWIEIPTSVKTSRAMGRHYRKYGVDYIMENRFL